MNRVSGWRSITAAPASTLPQQSMLSGREVYEQEVRDPMCQLIETLDAKLASIAPEIVGDRRRSTFRIHRDVRFSRNESPFKTNAGAWLYHRDAGRKVGTMGEGGGAGFYVHIDPTLCFVAGGVWEHSHSTAAGT